VWLSSGGSCDSDGVTIVSWNWRSLFGFCSFEQLSGIVRGSGVAEKRS